MKTMVSSGRIFRRTNGSGIGLVGVVEVPQELATECVRACLIHGGELRVDQAVGRPLADSVGEDVHPEVLMEVDANGMFNYQYASRASGAQELFFRQATIPPSAPGMKWCYIVGARRLELPQLPEDGMYELGSRLRKIDLPKAFGMGMNLGGLLRVPVWGPSGSYGMAHTLELGFYEQWVKVERARNAQRDPQFARFMEAMAPYGEPPLYYTAAQKEEREVLADRVMHEILAGQDAARPRG